MAEQKALLKTLAEIDAIITESHIVYTSGKHGSAYVNKDAIYPRTALTSELCLQIAKEFQNAGVEVVVAPVIGGVILSQWIAFHLSALTKKEVLGVYAEKSEGPEGFVLKRGYDKIVSGKKILIVEDVLNTGGSVKKVVDVVNGLGGNILAVAALCNRGAVTTSMLGDVPKLYSILNIDLETWDEKDCPLCAKKIPINTAVGKGKEYLRKKSS